MKTKEANRSPVEIDERNKLRKRLTSFILMVSLIFFPVTIRKIIRLLLSF